MKTAPGTDLALPTAAPEPEGLGEQLKPWTAMGLLVVAASAERLAVTLAGREAELALGTAAAAFVAAVVVATWSKRRLMSKHLRRRFIAAVWGAAGWLTYVAAMGLSWGAVATLTTVGALLSLLYWREHRIYAGPEVVLLAEDDTADLFADRWRKNLGAKGRPLAGSRLVDREIIKSGYRYTLALVPADHTVDQVRGLEGTLRSGLQLMPGQQVIVEDHPTLPAPTALLTIVTKSTVTKDQPWPGPAGAFDPIRGSVNLGPFIDGEGIARWSVYRQDGIFGGFIQGGTGSGKSRMIEVIAMACASSISHPTTVWFGCGQNGDSSPLLVDTADYVATSAEAVLDMLKAAEKVMAVNGIENRMARQRGFIPSMKRPGLLVVVDEFHNFLAHKEIGPIALEIQDKMVKIAREGRKVGVALILATQEPLLAAFGHPSKADNLRSRLLEGNGVVLRSETNNAKTVFQVNVSPRSFPKLPGYAYLARPAEGERQAPFRGFYVNDEQIDRWAHSFPWHALPARQAQYAGSKYAKRRQVVDEQRHEDEMLLSMLDGGTFEELEQLSLELDRAEASESFGDHMPAFGKVAKFWEQPRQATPAGPQLGEGQRKVLAAIRAGHQKPAAIMSVTGYQTTHTHAVLNSLIRLGLIRKAEYGKYRLLQVPA